MVDTVPTQPPPEETAETWTVDLRDRDMFGWQGRKAEIKWLNDNGISFEVRALMLKYADRASGDGGMIRPYIRFTFTNEADAALFKLFHF